MDEQMISVLLTAEEAETVREALESWVKSAESDSMLAGLMMSAIMSRDDPGESEQGAALRERMRLSGIESATERRKKIYAILAKLF